MEVFPTELTRLIISHISDKRILATLARCSSKYRSLAEGIIYHSLRATKLQLPRQASHFIQYPHLAVHLKVLLILDEEWSSQSTEVEAAEAVRKILQLAPNLEELYCPQSSNGAHGDVFKGACCFNIRVLRCYFRDAELEICDFIRKCKFLEDLELTPSFGEYHNLRVARDLSSNISTDRLVLPLSSHYHLRRLSVPAAHILGIKVGNQLRHYVDESESLFGLEHLVHLSRVTGARLTMLDVENLPESTSFLRLLPDMLPNLKLLATPSIFTDIMYEPAVATAHNATILDVLSRLTHLERIMLRGNHDDERQPNLLYDFVEKLKARAKPKHTIVTSRGGIITQGGHLTSLRLVMIWSPTSRDQWGSTFIRTDVDGVLGREWEEHLNVPMSLLARSSPKSK